MRRYFVMIACAMGSLISSADKLEEATREVVSKSSALKEISAIETNPLNLSEALTNADQEVTHLVAQLLTKTTDMEEINGSVGEHLVFRKYPKSINKDTRHEFQQGGGDSVSVNYRRDDLKDGTVLYFCENTFPGKTNSYGRISPSAYAVHISGTNTTISRFQEYDDNRGMRAYPDNGPMLLDVLYTQESFPKVIMLYGPQGTGHFASLRLFSYNHQGNSWIQSNILELSGVKDYRYDADTHEFQYSAYDSSLLKNYSVNLQSALSLDIKRGKGLIPEEVRSSGE